MGWKELLLFSPAVNFVHISLIKRVLLFFTRVTTQHFNCLNILIKYTPCKPVQIYEIKKIISYNIHIYTYIWASYLKEHNENDLTIWSILYLIWKYLQILWQKITEIT